MSQEIQILVTGPSSVEYVVLVLVSLLFLWTVSKIWIKYRILKKVNDNLAEVAA